MATAIEPRFDCIDSLSQYAAKGKSARSTNSNLGTLTRDDSSTGLGFQPRHGALKRASMRIYNNVNQTIHKLLNTVEHRIARLESSVQHYFSNKSKATHTQVKPTSDPGVDTIDIAKGIVVKARMKFPPLAELNGETITFPHLEALYLQNKSDGPLRSIATFGIFFEGSVRTLLAGNPEKLNAHNEFLKLHPDIGEVLTRTRKWGDDRAYADSRETYADNPTLFRDKVGVALCNDFQHLIDVFRDYQWQIFPETRDDIDAELRLAKPAPTPESTSTSAKLLEAPQSTTYKQLRNNNWNDIPLVDEDPVKISEENRSFASSIPHVRAWRREYLAT